MLQRKIYQLSCDGREVQIFLREFSKDGLNQPLF